MDLDHSYLEGEIEADGADEDYSLEHQVSILLKDSFTPLSIYTCSPLHDHRIYCTPLLLSHSQPQSLSSLPCITDYFSCAPCTSTVKMEATSSTETVNICQPTWYYIPESSTLHLHQLIITSLIKCVFHYFLHSILLDQYLVSTQFMQKHLQVFM